LLVIAVLYEYGSFLNPLTRWASTASSGWLFQNCFTEYIRICLNFSLIQLPGSNLKMESFFAQNANQILSSILRE